MFSYKYLNIMNEWINKYLKFYDVSLSDTKKEDNIIFSKLNGKKTNLKISINLETFYQVMLKRFLDDINVSVFISDDSELISITSDNKTLLDDLQFNYGGWVDKSKAYSDKFKHKYILIVFEYNVKEENKINAII